MSSPATATDAAGLVRAERSRIRRETELNTNTQLVAPKKETISSVGWVATEAGEVDESELTRKQRIISEKLARKHAQILKDGEELERVRAELTSMEAPLKAEIMSLRTALEDANKREKVLVDAVNDLRVDLHNKEVSLCSVRAEKQQLADKLIDVMADYEKRKTDILNGIACLVGEDPLDSPTLSAANRKSSKFSGF